MKVMQGVDLKPEDNRNPEVKLSLVIPFVDSWDVMRRCLEKVAENSNPETEVWLIDNGSDPRQDYPYYDEALDILSKFKSAHYRRNPNNTGVLATFKQGLELSQGSIVCFIHSDVLLQEKDWDRKVIGIFENDPKLGLAGLFGAVGVGDNGGRVRPMSKMLGEEWGKCDCHEVAWQHHSEYLDGVHPATILDGVGMFFRREALESLTLTDMFADWRAPHHFYDRIMPLKLIDKGWKIATIGIGFDHWSGATANSSEKYIETAARWIESQDIGGYQWALDKGPDGIVYDQAERQFFNEFGKRIPCNVDSNWNYHWTGLGV